jgi:hypothetical protein
MLTNRRLCELIFTTNKKRKSGFFEGILAIHLRMFKFGQFMDFKVTKRLTTLKLRPIMKIL